MSIEYTVYWSQSARNDLLDILEYISTESVTAAQKVFESIRKHSSKLESLPERGRIVPELKAHNITTYRELIIAPWRLIYRIENRQVYVLAFFDARRNLEDVILSRIMK